MLNFFYKTHFPITVEENYEDNYSFPVSLVLD